MSENIADPGKVIQLRATEVDSEVHLEAAEPPVYLDTTPADAVQRRPKIGRASCRERV